MTKKPTPKAKFYRCTPIKKSKPIEDRAYFQFRIFNEDTWRIAPDNLRTFEEVKAFIVGKYGKENGFEARLVFVYQNANVWSYLL